MQDEGQVSCWDAVLTSVQTSRSVLDVPKNCLSCKRVDAKVCMFHMRVYVSFTRFICMCLYMCVCTYLYACICVYFYVCICVYLYGCISVYLYAYVWVFLYACICVYMYVCVQMCVHYPMHENLHIHIH
jgi:hypothetical protein